MFKWHAMLSKIKNFLDRKKIILLVFSIIFLTLFASAKSVQAAGFWEWVSGMTTAVPSMVISFAIFVLGAITSIFAGFAGMLLSFVIGPNFTALSYTNPADNPVIKLGLGITQGFANIILVLILIYIALATILRLAGYETKKILPRFIIVALLVNFTPVLCGLIVDASNIIMNYFAQPLIGAGGLSSLVGQLKNMWSMFAAGFDVNVLVSTTAQLSQIFKLIAASVFYFFLALILLLYTGVFAARYVAIWILVILSPIAFACFIMPKGNPLRRAWDIWWEQLIQWCIIGILGMFFLYLGIQLMVQAPNLFKGSLGSADYKFFDMILPYTVPLAFLYLGWIMATQTTAFGAKAIMEGGRRGTKAVTKMTASRGWQWTAAGTAAVAAEAGRIRSSYQAGRTRPIALGGAMTRTQALGTALRGSWYTRVRPAITTPATYTAAGMGVLRAIRNTAAAGGRAALGLKRRGFKRCPSCGNVRVAASADRCPTCGNLF